MNRSELRWCAYHIHYSTLEALILECVQPFFEQHGDGLERRYWLRHYAGGPHLRVRLCSTPERLERAGEALVRRAEEFLAARPSADLQEYSERRAAALLKAEGVKETPSEELTYRNNAVVMRRYPPARDVYVSCEAAELMDDFRHRVMTLTHRVLVGPRPRRELVLRLFFLQALITTGELPAGSVSSKSHWEGFAATFVSEAVVEQIRKAYRHHRRRIRNAMLEVAEAHEADTIDRDPVLAEWRDILIAFRARTRRALAAGRQFTVQPSTLEEAADSRIKTHAILRRDSSFVRAFWADEVFAASIQFEPRMLVPRVLTNLLYDLVAMVGLSPIDKFSLCYFAHRAVEEHFECDLEAILNRNIAWMKNRHGHRFTASPGPAAAHG